MTGGRVYLWDPDGSQVDALDRASAGAVRLASVMTERDDGADRIDDLRIMLEEHRAAGSRLARRLLEHKARLGDEVWLIEPVRVPVTTEAVRSNVALAGREAGAAIVR
jgi:glutamate synthase domain-containing protein 3